MTKDEATIAAEQAADFQEKVASTFTAEDTKAAGSQDAYDDEVLRGLEKGKSNREAMQAADAKRKEVLDKDEDDEEEEEEEEEAEAEGKAKEKEGEGETKHSAIYEKALKALQRGLPKGIRDATIKGMSHEQILEAGLEMAEQQANQDRTGNELDQLNKSKDGQQKEGGTDEDGDGKTVSDPSSKVDFSKVLEPLDADLYGEELPKTFSRFGNTIMDLVQEHVGQVVAQLQTGFEEHVLDGVRRQEMGEVPILRDADAWTRVRTAMKELEPAMEFKADELLHARMAKLLDRALHAEFPDEMAELAVKRKGPRATRKRTAGQTDGPGRRSGPAKKPTGEDAEDTFLRTRERTGSARKASEAAGYVD